MISPRTRAIAAILAIAVGILTAGALYVVDETKQVVVTQLGRPIGKPITEAGLHLKVPFIQKANFFEKRVMEWDGRPTQIPTRDKKYIWVDTTARWRILDPLLFLQRAGSVATVLSRLDGIIDSIVRDQVSNNNLEELVRSEGWEEAKQKLMEAGLPDMQFLGAFRDAHSDKLLKGRERITREMVVNATDLVPEFGIELLDIRIKRINYVDSVQEKVFDRMISERQRIAAQYRSEGEGERAAILGQMEREMARINSEAFRTSQELRGKADAEATRIYAEAFGQDVGFFEFYRTLDFYKNFNNPNSSFVLTTAADIFKYLKDGTGAARQ